MTTLEFDPTRKCTNEHRVTVELDAEQLRRPLLERAGITDLNSMINALPEDVVQEWCTPPRDFYVFVRTLEEAVHSARGQQKAEIGEYGDHTMYPVTTDGFIGSLLETDLFKRQFGVHQLGPLRIYPLPALHTRGQHEIYTTVNMVRTLQTLADRDPDTLETRARRDFAEQPFFDEEMSREDLFNLLSDLSVLAGVTHDWATPAGGDTMKYVFNMNEEKDLEWLFFSDNLRLARQQAQLREVLARQGLTDDHLRFVVDCIQGNSLSLIGDIIHPSHGDHLDCDRVGYSLLDARAAGILGIDMPTRLFPHEITPRQTRKLQQALDDAIGLLQKPELIGVLATYFDERGDNSVSWIDPTDDYILDQEGNLVNTQPDKLTWIAALRLNMIAHHYAGGKMLGFETKLQQRLHHLLIMGVGTDLLTKENLLSMTDREVYRALGKLDDYELNKILSEVNQGFSKSAYDSAIVPADANITGAFAEYPLTAKPGLDTRVKYRGRVMTLGEYIWEDPYTVPRSLFAGISKETRGKKVLIWKADNRQREILF